LLLYLFKNKINTFSKKSIDLINLSKTNSLIVLLTSMTIFFLLTQIEKKSLPEFPVVGLWLYSNKTFKSDLIKEIEDLPNYKSLYYSSGNSSFLTQNFNQFSFKNWMFINFNEKTDINEVRLKLAKFDVLLEPEINPFSEIFDETGLGLNSKIVPESYLRSIENNNSSFLGGPMTMYKKTYIPHLNQELSLKNLEDYMVNTHKGKLLGSINQSIYSMEVLSKYNPNIANTNNYTLKGFDIRSLFDIKTAEEWYPKITTKESQGVNIYTKDLDMQKIDSEGLGWYFVISVLILYVIILVQFESFVISLSMMSLVVISLFGGLLGLYIADITLNTMSILGLFVTVGVGVNDVILKAEGIQNNLKSGLSLDESINESSNSRLRPILFTSLTTLVSLVPIFFQENSISTSIVKSLAVPLFYGLIFSTIYSLIFINNSLKWAFNISIKKGI
jgi:hypothetical protein